MKTTSYDEVLKRVPAHLRQYVRYQDYSQYTPIQQAVWRYVMRQNLKFLSKTAHSDYVQGLKATGIHIEYIPNIDEMNECLSEIGWGAVVVDGLIPSVAFFDFQAHNLLPVSVDIRSLDHIEYTPAPDIIHEAAGHAPILLNPKYREYIRVFGEIGAKAIATKEEHDVFEAVRQLTIILENPESTELEIEEAESVLAEKRKARIVRSEASLISRLYWWTVEYGLIGDLNHPIIYGAGLLSSVGESMNCLSDTVKKLPFDVTTCINTSYDVTHQQPQLFVCESFEELIDGVNGFAASMAVNVGGTEGLLKAKGSGKTTTIVYSSGLQVSGTVDDVVTNGCEAVYFRTVGPTALAVNERELTGHGVGYHKHGFGAPIGTLKDLNKPLEHLSDSELDALGITVGNDVHLTFDSGVEVSGIVKEITRTDNRLVLISFDKCQVKFLDSFLFKPEWGTYDMAVGTNITSVFAGAADSESFFPEAMVPKRGEVTQRVRTEIEDLYQRVRDIRNDSSDAPRIESEVHAIFDLAKSRFGSEWLLWLELFEIASQRTELDELSLALMEHLTLIKTQHSQFAHLIDNGVEHIQPLHPTLRRMRPK